MEYFEKLKSIALPDKLSFYPAKQSDFAGGSELYANFERFQKFCEGLQETDDTDLNELLEIIDEEYRIDSEDESVKDIVTTTESIIGDVVNAIGYLDPRFKGTVINSGSFYDDLKIGEVDEFDFVIRLDILSKDGAFEAKRAEHKKGFVYLAAKDEDVAEVFKEFITLPTAEDRDQALIDGEKILNVENFQQYFNELVHRAVQVIDIPENFIPVDSSGDLLEDTTEWFPKRHGPCATLYAAYVCNVTGKVVNIDIDLAPCIAFPGQQYTPPVIDVLSAEYPNNSFLTLLKNIVGKTDVLLVPFRFDRTEKSGEQTWTHHYSNTWRISHSSLEKAVFARFERLDTEKKMCRILKVLKEILIQGTTKTEREANSEHLKLREPPSTFLTGVTVEPIGGFDEMENESDSDVSTNRDDFEYEVIYERIKSKNKDKLVRAGKVREVSKTDNGDAEDKTDTSCDIVENERTKIKKENSVEVNDAEEKTLISSVLPMYCTEKQMKMKQGSKQNIGSSGNIEEQFQASQASNFAASKETSLESRLVSGRKLSGEPTESKSDSNPEVGSLSAVVYQSEIEHCFLANAAFHYHSDDDRKTTAFDCQNNKNPRFKSNESSHELLSKFPGSFEQPSTVLQSMTVGLESIDETVEQEKVMIAYRDSKPLLKTYFIKMLFLAMKAALPEEYWWTSDMLAFLVKLALSMTYYAYSTPAKGILNFWLQDLIENRTKESTRVEVLYCLDTILEVFKKH